MQSRSPYFRLQAIRRADTHYIIAPKYKEVSLKVLWPLVKEIDELSVYFLDLGDDELPDREYLWTVISTLRPNATAKLVEDAR